MKKLALLLMMIFLVGCNSTEKNKYKLFNIVSKDLNNLTQDIKKGKDINKYFCFVENNQPVLAKQKLVQLNQLKEINQPKNKQEKINAISDNFFASNILALQANQNTDFNIKILSLPASFETNFKNYTHHGQITANFMETKASKSFIKYFVKNEVQSLYEANLIAKKDLKSQEKEYLSELNFTGKNKYCFMDITIH